MRRFTINDLEKKLREKFGEINQNDIWQAYEYLKDYCGMKTKFLDEKEYSRRHENIIETLGL